MRSIFLIARREVSTYLNSWWGWAILAIVLLIDGLLFNAWAMGSSPRYSADVLQSFFESASGPTMVAAIMIAMPLLAQERQQGTLVLLETAPVSEAEVIAGKYLGALAFLTFITALTFYMPALVQVNGKVSWAQVGTGYLGLFGLGASALAIGMFGSAIAKNQILAAIVGGALFVLFVTAWYLGKVSSPPFADIATYSAIWDRHYQPFMRGRINTESLVYFGSIVFAFLLLSTRALQARRWQ